MNQKRKRKRSCAYLDMKEVGALQKARKDNSVAL